MKKLFKEFTKKDMMMIVISILLIVFQVWLDLKLPDYMSEITRLIQLENSKLQDILLQGGYMLLCALGSLLSAFIVGYLSSQVAANFSLNVRKKLFHKVESFGMEEMKKFSTSSLITRTTNDVSQVEMLISMGLQLLIKAPIMAFWAISKILGKNMTWSVITFAGVFILLATVITLMIIVLPRFKVVQQLIDRLNGVTRENLTGIRVIRAFNAEAYQENRFEQVNTDLTNMQLFNQHCFAVLNPVMNLVSSFLTLGIYFLGAFMVQQANMLDKINLFSDMIVFTSYGMQVIMAFLMLAMIFMMWPRLEVSAARINEVLDSLVAIVDGNNDGSTITEVGTVEFQHVSFKYPDADEYLLKDISFQAKKGQTIAFIGFYW